MYLSTILRIHKYYKFDYVFLSILHKTLPNHFISASLQASYSFISGSSGCGYTVSKSASNSVRLIFSFSSSSSAHLCSTFSCSKIIAVVDDGLHLPVDLPGYRFAVTLGMCQIPADKYLIVVIIIIDHTDIV